MTASNELTREGRLPSFEGALEWLNSEPLTVAELRGRVVLVQFWTYTCINWLRTLPYVRAWDEAYRDQGLLVIGVHTPEFGVEHEVGNIRRALEAMRIPYPVAVDSDYAVWDAFDNRYWPAAYFADAEGVIRSHQFGEGRYQEQERVIQRLLLESGRREVDRDLVSVVGRGAEAPADWSTLESGESYVGWARGEGLASPERPEADSARSYTIPASLGRGRWALGGSWTIGREAAHANEAGGRIAMRFHARDLHLVMGAADGAPSSFQVRIDGGAPDEAHGVDVDAAGNGTVAEARLYQLVRQSGRIEDRTFELTFEDAGAEAFVFTFG
jgi:thiol-disulfide isomerase/thioredoxin